jgi:hypothetical protein
VKTFFKILLLTIVHWQTCYAQFTDDFSDNDFTANPVWSGGINEFGIVNGMLQLLAPKVAAASYLVTPSFAINNAQWEFYLQMDFNPSSSNYAKIYLVADQPILTGSLNGYFIKAGNTADEVSLYRQDGLIETKIIDGLDGILNTTSVKVKIKATRDANGNWQLFSDAGVTGNYSLEGNATDITHLSSTYFGVLCKYTPTRSDKFHFDNFVVSGDPIPDTAPPIVEQVTLVSDHELSVKFSENLDLQSAETVTNFVVDHSINTPTVAELQSDLRTIKLSFANNFPNGIECQLSVTGVKDLAGNVMNDAQKSFLYFQGQPVSFKDVVITEIFPDPDPVVSLPAAEFIEVYNRSSNPINFADWSISDGTSTAHFPFLILFPNEYLIVTATDKATLFESAGRVTGLTSFPTLNNLADHLVLKDIDDVTIDSLFYNITWYKDDDKQDGGWTLEKIDPNNICAEADNWVASENELGGTPGKQNSVFANKPDLTSPELLSVIAISSDTLALLFNEKLEKITPAISDFTITPGTNLKSISFADQSLTLLHLSLASSLATKTLYTIALKSIRDCAGNTIEQTKMEFALPEQPDSSDIVINEILFNPRPTGVDFVEIFNNSSKFINLKNFSLANTNGKQLENEKVISGSDLLLRPASYLLLTENSNVVKGEYLGAHQENFYEMDALPSLNDDEGSVALVDNSGKMIDHFVYSKNMHSALIKDDEGVSLERISFDEPTNLIDNWKSASTSAGYATPGYRNSNSRTDALLPDEAIKVDPEIFIPITGHPDFTEINYSFKQGGYIASVKIYDAQGRVIKLLADNEVLGTEGFYRWDGDQDDGTKARVGYYVVAFDVFNDSGSVKTFRKRVVVATKF